MSLTHAELVERAARWLRVTKRCAPVLQEIGTCSESPDAIGWQSRFSILVECKASWSDFERDSKKWFRRDAERGLGHSSFRQSAERPRVGVARSSARSLLRSSTAIRTRPLAA